MGELLFSLYLGLDSELEGTLPLRTPSLVPHKPPGFTLISSAIPC